MFLFSVPATSVVECGDPPELSNGRVSHLNETFVTYDCDDGYFFQEGLSTSRTCLENGNWTKENIICCKLMRHVTQAHNKWVAAQGYEFGMSGGGK